MTHVISPIHGFQGVGCKSDDFVLNGRLQGHIAVLHGRRHIVWPRHPASTAPGIRIVRGDVDLAQLVGGLLPKFPGLGMLE